MKIATVLRSGGVYTFEDVTLLYHQARAHNIIPRGCEFVCFSDQQHEHPTIRTIPLKRNWPGWWSKLELFDMDHTTADLLYFDLDTMIVRDMPELAVQLEYDQRPAILQDFYEASRVQSSIMWIPNREKGMIFSMFTHNAQQHMLRHAEGGDQEFLNYFWYHRARRLQNAFPGRFVSFKATLNEARYVPAPASIVVFHGKPKPRDIGWTLSTE